MKNELNESGSIADVLANAVHNASVDVTKLGEALNDFLKGVQTND